jgi:hypothetical protein
MQEVNTVDEIVHDHALEMELLHAKRKAEGEARTADSLPKPAETAPSLWVVAGLQPPRLLPLGSAGSHTLSCSHPCGPTLDGPTPTQAA